MRPGSSMFRPRPSRSWCTAIAKKPILGPRQAVYRPVGARRLESTEAGENKTGHIEATENQSIVFLDHIFPIHYSWLFNRPLRAFIDFEQYTPRLLKRINLPISADPKVVAEETLSQQGSTKILEVLPRIGDGGAYVKFSHDPAQSLDEIEERLQKYLKAHPIRPWFNPLTRMRASIVRGRPWLEDLRRMPSSVLKVSFTPSAPGQPVQELSPEVLFSLFRRYGKLQDITPQPVDSKDLPRYAVLNFSKTRRAIMAKSCLHGFFVGPKDEGGSVGTILKISYLRNKKGFWIWDWLMNHPRITFPLLLAILSGCSVAILDPIRTFFVKNHVDRSFHISENRFFKFLSSQASRANALLKLRRSGHEDAGLIAIWDDRKPDIEQIQSWLMESADTFIVVQGPRGSGKKELVMDQALKGRKDTLLLDAKSIQECHSDSKTIGTAAAEVGYRPVFSWMNSVNSLIDLAAAGAIGTKTGFSETLDTQLAKIWQTTGTALRRVALEKRKKEDKDSNLGDDEWLEAHPEKRPIVVIDNFLHKSQENNVVYDKLAEWGASLTTANIAHVIFLTTDVSFSKSLSKALPDRVFRQIALGDTSPEVAKRFVVNHLDSDYDETADAEKIKPSQRREDLHELDDCITTLGGRLTDLEFLARRIKAGETPKRAVSEIIDQSASEVLKMYILDVSSGKSHQWSPEQAWVLIQGLATKDSLRYNEVLLSDSFKSNEGTLQALEQAELITIVSANGRPQSIKAGKPVYSAAFAQLTQDHVLKARLDLSILSDLTKQETSAIDKYEAELQLLGQLPKQPPQIRERVSWLLQKLSASQTKIEGFEKESAGLKKILQSEY